MVRSADFAGPSVADPVAPKADIILGTPAPVFDPTRPISLVGERAMFTISNPRVLCRRYQLISA